MFSNVSHVSRCKVCLLQEVRQASLWAYLPQTPSTVWLPKQWMLKRQMTVLIGLGGRGPGLMLPQVQEVVCMIHQLYMLAPSRWLDEPTPLPEPQEHSCCLQVHIAVEYTSDVPFQRRSQWGAGILCLLSASFAHHIWKWMSSGSQMCQVYAVQPAEWSRRHTPVEVVDFARMMARDCAVSMLIKDI